jgi:predicted nucleotidyltransferase
VQSLLTQSRKAILEIASRHGARNIRVFGSMARDEARPDSDVDLLVELEESRSLLDQAGLIRDLEKLLRRKVHVVEPLGLHWYIRDRVIEEAVPL